MILEFFSFTSHAHAHAQDYIAKYFPNQKLYSQLEKKWLNVGEQGFSKSIVSHTTLAIAPNGTLYMGYIEREYPHGGKLTVKSFNGSEWVNVGKQGFSDNMVSDITLTVASNNIPYVGYYDMGKRATVKSFNESDWVDVGNPGFSRSLIYFTTLVIASDGTPYIGYQDIANQGKATVMYYNKEEKKWLSVGKPGFSDGEVRFASLAIASDDTLYMGYKDSVNGGKATVMYYNKEERKWQSVGEKGFSDGEATFARLAIASDGTLYMGYRDSANRDRATVMYYNKEERKWQSVGDPGFSELEANYLTLAVAPNGTPYVGYTDYAHGSKATVKSFNGNEWVDVGDPGFSAGMAFYPTLAIAYNNIPYMGYVDVATNHKTTVMRFRALSK